MPEYTEIPTHDKTQTPPFDWRAHLDVHPAAGLFPSLPEAELQELAEDIQKNGLRAPIISWSPGGLESPVLLDGRNRLDALARLGVLYETDDHHLGLRTWTGTKWAKLSGDRIHFQHFHGDDPYALVLSLNVHRRHLTIEQKEEVTAKVIKANPEKSNRRIAAEVKVVSHPTVAKVRKRTRTEGRRGNGFHVDRHQGSEATREEVEVGSGYRSRRQRRECEEIRRGGHASG